MLGISSVLFDVTTTLKILLISAVSFIFCCQICKVGVGNHERFYDYAAVQNRYKMPFEKSGGNGDFWYSYSYGNVHWISLSSEEDMAADSPQLAFLQQDLERAVANRVRVDLT